MPFLGVHENGSDPLYIQSLEIYRQRNEPFWQAQVLENLGHCYRQGGQYTEAQAVLQESLVLRRSTGDAYGVARSIRELGFVAYLQGNDRATEDAWQEAFDMQSRLGDQQGIADSLFFLCVLYLTRSDWRRAQQLAEKVAAIAVNLNSQLYQHWAARAHELVSAMAQAATGTTGAAAPFPCRVTPFTAKLFFFLFTTAEPGYSNHLRGTLMTATSDAEKAICFLFAAKLYAQTDALETAVELLALARRHANVVDGWIARLPEIVGLQRRLESGLDPQVFQSAWRQAQALHMESTAQKVAAFLSPEQSV